MTLIPGTRLGPYEILAPLGHGGMGEVYKARDTRLDRTVAIKVLPEALASDPTFRERFDREAKAIAALQHPHICTLHDVGHQDGVAYLVLEYLDGQTLAERLTRGALPIDQALTYAIQIADALDKAHRAGIVHRDLKPGNVMVTKSGVKLLDFGLAKTRVGGAGVAGGLSQLPTEQGLTAHGTILGTFQYMAPEQLEGKDADARTDIFAFGAVVYEMVTGRKAFEGKSHASLISAIMSSEPTAMVTLQPITPPGLDHIVKTCLTKDPDGRWQSSSDLNRELKWIADGDSQIRQQAPVRSTRLVWAIAVLMFVGLVVLSMPALVHLREAPASSPPEMRVEIATPPTSDPMSFALSPNGRGVVFAAGYGPDQRLWLRMLDQSTAEPLAGTEGARFPFWSPDSRSIVFFDGSTLKRLDIGEGAAYTLANVGFVRGGTWSPDNVILFNRSATAGLSRMPASGGEIVPVTTLGKQTNHRFPQFLPDGRHFLFYAQGPSETSGIYLGSLDGIEPSRLTAADAAGVYASGEWLLFVRGGILFAQRLDLQRGMLTGSTFTIADTVALDAGMSAGAVSVSSNGLVAYRVGGVASRRQFTWFDRTGRALGVIGDPDGTQGSVRLSPDGQRVATSRMVQGNTDIWILDADRAVRFTSDANVDRFPIWSPDGASLMFDSPRAGTGIRQFYRKPANSAANEDLLFESAQEKGANDWSPDGRHIVYAVADPETSWDLWMLPLDGDRKPFVFVKTKFDERRASFSPDGHWVAYQSNESGRFEAYVRPFPGPGGQQLISTAGGMSPRWARDGKEIFYIEPDGTLMATPVAIKGPLFEPGRPITLFRTKILGFGTDPNGGLNYDVSRDGRFLINSVLDDSAASPITLLVNWTPERQP